MANLVAFNKAITSTGTTQALDPSGVEPLAYAQTLTIYALAANTAKIYISNAVGTGAGVGYPLEAGKILVVDFPSTGLFVTGTAADVYGVIGS